MMLVATLFELLLARRSIGSRPIVLDLLWRPRSILSRGYPRVYVLFELHATEDQLGWANSDPSLRCRLGSAWPQGAPTPRPGSLVPAARGSMTGPEAQRWTEERLFLQAGIGLAHLCANLSLHLAARYGRCIESQMNSQGVKASTCRSL